MLARQTSGLNKTCDDFLLDSVVFWLGKRVKHGDYIWTLSITAIYPGLDMYPLMLVVAVETLEGLSKIARTHVFYNPIFVR
jgi:hypothetical protein